MNKKIKTYTTAELKTITEKMVLEIKKAEKGERNSLAFVRQRIPDKKTEKEERLQVIVIGGSNLQKAEVKKRDKMLEITNATRKKLPIFDTKNTLLKLIGDSLPDELTKVSINFAYPLTPVYRKNRIDGKLIRGTKEHTFKGLVGKNVGEEIENYILKEKNKKIEVFLANDTVCLVTAGLEISTPEKLAGGVVGTGFNFGFFIDDNTVINLEAGNFNKFTPTESGAYIDADSETKGRQLWEKEISGAYLYRHYNYYIEKLFKGKGKIESTKELDSVSRGADSRAELANEILERSASLTAVQITAIKRFKGFEILEVIIEGSLFWEGLNYQNTVTEKIKILAIDEENIKITHIENSSIKGAARLII